MNLQNIIETVNEVSGLDIRTKTRQREYVYARCIYFKIAKTHTLNPIRTIREPLNIKQQQTVYSVLNQFDSIVKYENYYKMYQSCLELLGLPTDEVVFNTNKGVKITLTDTQQSVLNDLKQLSDYDLLQFQQTRLKPFLRMNKKVLIESN